MVLLCFVNSFLLLEGKKRFFSLGHLKFPPLWEETNMSQMTLSAQGTATFQLQVVETTDGHLSLVDS